METDLRLAHPMPQDAGFGDRLAGPRWVLALCFATIVFDGYDLIFAAFRFLAGLGLGGVMPTTVALTVEWAPPRRHHLFNALMFSGYSVGGIAAALLALWLLPHHGFRVLFALGMLPLVTVVPLARRFLPESRAFHRPVAGSGRRRGCNGAAALFARPRLAASLLFPLASFCGLLLVFGLNTWLPKIMQKAGYPVTSAIAFLVARSCGEPD